METDFPEIEERFSADAWRDPVYVEHRITHEDLQAATEAWLAAGGCITQVASGVQNATLSSFNSRIVSTSVAGLSASENQAAREQVTHMKRATRDAELCALLNELAPEGLQRAAYAARMGIKDSVLQRILKTYFARDRRFDYLRPVPHELTPSRSVKDAQWFLARGRIAIVAGVSMKRCSLCHADKPVVEFHLDSSKASGYASRCSACERENYAKRNGVRSRVDLGEIAA